MSSSEQPRPSLTRRLTDTTRVPQDVKVSYYLWGFYAAVFILYTLFILFAQSSSVIAGFFGLIFVLLIAALYMYCAIRMKEGAPWARMVLTILASLSAIVIIGSLLQGLGGLHLFGAIVAVIAAILMWTRNANPWFHQRR